MSRIDDFIDQVRRILDGDPWFGDPILRVLEGITHDQAARRVLPQGHTIWELVLHLTSWTREVNRRLVQGDWREPADGDWPVAPDPTAGNWRSAVARLEEAHRVLLTTLESFPASRLDEQLGTERDQGLGTGQTFGQMLHGLLQHDAYHLGQIGILKRGVRG
jgi:uncharacterized damage-inducible protein DinB